MFHSPISFVSCYLRAKVLQLSDKAKSGAKKVLWNKKTTEKRRKVIKSLAKWEKKCYFASQ
jgi:hypothetical protein